MSDNTQTAAEIPTPDIYDHSIGEWKNVHQDNPSLAGVLVQQFPDSALEAPAWEGKHPAMILFVMWDGRVNQIGYEPSGEIDENFWWDLNERDRDYSYVWNQLDYSHGSDPNFEHHQDPRKTANKLQHPTA